MLDPNVLLGDLEGAKRRLARKGVTGAAVEAVVGAIAERRRLAREADDVRAATNVASKEIGRLLAAGEREEAERRKARVAELKPRLSELERQLREAAACERSLALGLPNWPEEETPDGATAEDNVVLSEHGMPEHRYEDRDYTPHWEVGERLAIYDPARAAKISGSMFALLRNEGARLLRALVDYGLQLNRPRYEEFAPPHFVTTETFTATGHLPKFEREAYRLRDDELWAIPTGEVPLMSVHRDEILTEEELPKRYMAYTVCFRREAGSAGKDTRGMQRLHEFHKVELVKLCTPEQVEDEFASMLDDAVRPLRGLRLPYRIVDLCAGDLTFSSARIYDVEVYAPGTRRWLEVASVGKFTDFQARRANIRFRRDGKPQLVHALNGSAIATPRVWAAILEHYEEPDGSVRVPEPLIVYMGTDRIGP